MHRYRGVSSIRLAGSLYAPLSIPCYAKRAMRTRQNTRKATTLPGRYLTGRGLPTTVTLSDLSIGGCRFELPADSSFIIGMPLQIFIAGSGPHHANVKWVENGEAGITFAIPLEEEQIERFESGEAPLPPKSTDEAFDSVMEQRPQRFC